MFDDQIYFEKLRKRVAEKLGFQSSRYGEKHLKRRFASRMRSLGIEKFRDYLNFLEKNPGEYEKLIRNLTVNVTYWFRDEGVFTAFKNRIVPALISIKEGSGSKTIRIWCTGCSDGKEPYSVAMLLHEALNSRNLDFHVRIYASDIDEEMLGKAKRGIYNANEMGKLNKEYLSSYFTEVENGFMVKPEIRRMVKFEKLDLTKDRHHANCDVIFCRNVVIYFTRETKEELYMGFYNALRSDGFLILGKTESLAGDARSRFSSIDKKERIYQKA